MELFANRLRSFNGAFRLMLYTRLAVCIKKSVTMHTPGRVQILTLTLAMYHASFVYTYSQPCVWSLWWIYAL